MAIAFVDNVKGTAATGTSVSSAAQVVTGGNSLIVLVTNHSSRTVSSISDTAGNTYTQAVSASVTGTNACEIWYCDNCTGHATNVVQVNFSGALAAASEVYVAQFSGAQFEASSHNSSTNSLTVTAGSVTPANAADAFVAIASTTTSTTIAITSPASSTLQDSSTNGGENGIGYKLSIGASAVTPTFTWGAKSAAAASALFMAPQATTTSNESGTAAVIFGLSGDLTGTTSLTAIPLVLPERFLRRRWNPPKGSASLVIVPTSQTWSMGPNTVAAVFALSGDPAKDPKLVTPGVVAASFTLTGELLWSSPPVIPAVLPDRFLRRRWNAPKGSSSIPARVPQTSAFTPGTAASIFALAGDLARDPKLIVAGTSAASFSLSGALFKSVGGVGNADRGWQGFGGGFREQRRARLSGSFAGSPQTIAVVNGQASDFLASASTAALPAMSLTAGNCIVVGVGCDSTCTSVTDTAGNNYVKQLTISGLASFTWNETTIWYAKNTIGNGSNVVTAHYSVAGFSVMGSVQLSGADPVSPMDSVTATGRATTANSVTSGSFTPSNTGECAVAFGGVSSTQHTFTAGTNYTLRSSGVIASGIETRLDAPASGQIAAISWGGVTDHMDLGVVLVQPASAAGTSATGGLVRRWWPMPAHFTASRPPSAQTISTSGTVTMAFGASGGFTQIHVIAGLPAIAFGLSGVLIKPPRLLTLTGTVALAFGLAGVPSFTPTATIAISVRPTVVEINELFTVECTITDNAARTLQVVSVLPASTPAILVFGEVTCQDVAGYGRMLVGTQPTILHPGDARSFAYDGVAFVAGTYLLSVAFVDRRGNYYIPTHGAILTVLGV